MTSPNIVKIFFASFLGFLLLTIVVAGGVYLLQKKQVRQVACTREASICPDGSYVGRTGPHCEFAPCPEVKIEDIDTSTWKTYRNEEYGFEFKYPQDWIVSVSPGEKFSIQIFSKETFENNKIERPTYNDASIGILENQENEPFVKWYKNKNKGAPEATDDSLETMNTLNISGIESYYIVEDGPGYNPSVVYIPLPSMYLRFMTMWCVDLYPFENCAEKEGNPRFPQEILNTLKVN